MDFTNVEIKSEKEFLNEEVKCEENQKNVNANYIESDHTTTKENSTYNSKFYKIISDIDGVLIKSKSQHNDFFEDTEFDPTLQIKTETDYFPIENNKIINSKNQNESEKCGVEECNFNIIEGKNFMCENEYYGNLGKLSEHNGTDYVEDDNLRIPFRTQKKSKTRGEDNEYLQSSYIYQELVRRKHDEETMLQCKECDSQFDTSRKLMRHFRKTHTKDIVYKCDQCDYFSFKNCNYLRHLNIKHTKKVLHKCETCDYQTAVKDNLKRHVLGKHIKDYQHKCDFCDHRAALISDIKRHMNTVHTKQKLYNCNVCHYNATTLAAVKRHINSAHTEKTFINCEKCSYETTSTDNLKKHMKSKHTDEANFLKCDMCDYKSPFRRNLNLHIKTVHLKSATKYKCEQCPRIFSKKHYLKSHIEGKHSSDSQTLCIKEEFVDISLVKEEPIINFS